MPETRWRDLPPSPYESRNRGDHPGAIDQKCQIKRPHDAHPYGAIHAEGGLLFWCPGRK